MKLLWRHCNVISLNLEDARDSCIFAGSMFVKFYKAAKTMKSHAYNMPPAYIERLEFIYRNMQILYDKCKLVKIKDNHNKIMSNDDLIFWFFNKGLGDKHGLLFGSKYDKYVKFYEKLLKTNEPIKQIMEEMF